MGGRVGEVTQGERSRRRRTSGVDCMLTPQVRVDLRTEAL
jgi:hypothetical protein